MPSRSASPTNAPLEDRDLPWIDTPLLGDHKNAKMFPSNKNLSSEQNNSVNYNGQSQTHGVSQGKRQEDVALLCNNNEGEDSCRLDYEENTRHLTTCFMSPPPDPLRSNTEPDDSPSPQKQRVTFNVGGITFQTSEATVKKSSNWNFKVKSRCPKMFLKYVFYYS